MFISLTLPRCGASYSATVTRSACRIWSSDARESDSSTENSAISLESFPLAPGSWEEESGRWLDYVTEILGISYWEGEDYKGTKKTAPGLIAQLEDEDLRLAFWYDRGSSFCVSNYTETGPEIER